MGDDTTVWLDVEIRKLTEEAALVYDGDKEVWIPLSLILDHEDELEEGVELKIEVPEWKAIAVGLA
jgi:hypothetical protein